MPFWHLQLRPGFENDYAQTWPSREGFGPYVTAHITWWDGAEVGVFARAIDESVLIQRLPEDVFDFVTDPTKTALWQTTIDEWRQVTPGPMAVGTRVIGAR